MSAEIMSQCTSLERSLFLRSLEQADAAISLYCDVGFIPSGYRCSLFPVVCFSGLKAYISNSEHSCFCSFQFQAVGFEIVLFRSSASEWGFNLRPSHLSASHLSEGLVKNFQYLREIQKAHLSSKPCASWLGTFPCL